MTQNNLAKAHLAFFEMNRKLLHHVDEAINAVDRALNVYRESEAAFLIEKAERLREEILAAKGKL